MTLYSISNINKRQKISGLYKTICGLFKWISNVVIQHPHEIFHIEAFFNLERPPYMFSGQLQNGINEINKLEIISNRLMQPIRAKFGGLQDIIPIIYYDFLRSFISSIIFLLKIKCEVHLKSINSNFLLQDP